jgi:hypothetical protein
LGGAAGRTYDITLRFRGVVEEKTYNNGCFTGRYSSGGVPGADAYNVYRLSVSSPPQTYYLNAGTSFVTRTWAIDLTQTIQMDAGATVTLFADAIDATEIRNRDDSGAPISIPDVLPAQPYDGQFIQMDVLSVTPASVGTSSRAAGGALGFAGGQWVSIPDAPSLHPASLTIEAWFLQTGTGARTTPSSARATTRTSGTPIPSGFKATRSTPGSSRTVSGREISYPWTPDLGRWHHVAFTYDGTTLSVLSRWAAGVVRHRAGPIQTDGTPLYLGGDVGGSPTAGGSGSSTISGCTRASAPRPRSARTCANISSDPSPG